MRGFPFGQVEEERRAGIRPQQQWGGWEGVSCVHVHPCILYRLGLSLLPGEFHPLRAPAGAGRHHPGYSFVYNAQFRRAMQVMK